MMQTDQSIHVGAVASVKHGFEHFVHRELSFLEDRGATISVYPTKYQNGLYGPRETWNVYRWNFLSLFFAQWIVLFSHPVKYVQLLIEAIRYRSVIDFVIAVHFSGKMKDVDLIYATFGDRKLFISYFCKQLLGKPLMCTIHAYEIYDNPNEAMFARAIAACDQITTVTDYNRNQLQQRFGIAPDKVEVVRLSVDLETYRPEEKFIVLIVGYFAQKKGHRILFEAIQKLNDERFEVWVVGTGRDSVDSVDLKGLAKDMGIESQIAFFGGLSNTALRAVYHACDVFCLPSHFDEFGAAEGFPTVIIEAMACGKPVISTRHVEIPAIVEQILVDEKDVNGLADALLQVYQSEPLRRQMGIRNREIAEERFSPNNAKRTEAIMKSLCK
ncbi:D-inositol 3-phosphate glycosyltransferase [Planctomycetes bacterium CA13]|uniref:D-inositol 3-phosphate glycosyltransferase n=1 Tax=Novipirellula herctigrandis TaxID=2527986 RepID=A0A5C5Z4I1_9BACT|nr:D-inositol 3-phosphate glycosyltransferase [Planctomycetes bacterium CA13]